jgi:hypothetical protein
LTDAATIIIDDALAPAAAAQAIQAATIVVDGEAHMRDDKGRLVPVSTIAAQRRLEDETVRTIMFHADALNAQIRRFKDHTLGDISDLLDLLAQDYGVTKGGRKGNLTLTSFDGLSQVKLAVADQVAFGPQLQAAKTLVDACLKEWASESHAALRVIVQDAFDTEKEGHVTPAKLFPLLRYDIEDERWNRAMDAIRDAIQIRGSKEYVLFYRRAKPTDRWQRVTIDLAAA